MDLTGRIALQRAKDSDTSADVLWRCAVTAETPATISVEVRRARGGAVLKKGGALVLKAEDETELATGSDGKVGTTLPARTTSAGTIETWVFLVAAPPLARDVELELWAAPAGGSLQKLAASAPAAVPASAFNAGTSVLTLDEIKLPRLSIGINSASPDLVPDKYGRTTMLDRPSGNPGKSSGRSADDNAALLYQLYVHLDRPSTLNPAWDQQTSPETTDISLSDAAYNATPARVAEERWARQVTEMLLLSTYGGPGVRYNQGRAFDELDLCGAGVQQGATNPVFGLSFACQHLATFGVSSRGERLLPRQINAGSYAALTVKDAGGVWLDHHDPPQEDADAHQGPPSMPEGGNTYDVRPLLAHEPARYGPGSVHLFSNRRVRTPQDQPTYERLARSLSERKLDWGRATVLVTRDVRGHLAELTISMNGPDHWQTRFLTYDSTWLADNQDSTHVGFVLRKGKVNGQPKMQLLDTGGFGVVGRDANLYGPGAFSGNYDDPAATEIHGGSPFRGTGVFSLPVTKPDADRLNDHVKTVLQVARPLGIVRFALVRRGANFQLGNVKRMVRASLAGTSNDFHYISPAALMYDQDEDTQNYPIVRYLWSLRNMPNSAELQGLWLIYVPTGTLAAAMRAAGRSTTLATLVASGSGGGDASLWLAAHTAPLTVASVNADGTLRMLGSNRGFLHPLTTLEKRQDWQENVLPMDQALAAGGAVTDAIPYFTWR